MTAIPEPSRDLAPSDCHGRASASRRLPASGPSPLLIITSFYPPTFQAASNRVQSLVSYLSAQDPRAGLWVLVLKSGGHAESYEGGVPGVLRPDSPFRLTPLNPLAMAWASFICVKQIRRLSPSRVMVSVPPANTLLAGLLAAHLTRKPVVVDLHDDWRGVYRDSFPEKGILRSIYTILLLVYGGASAILYRSAAGMLVVNETLARMFRRIYPGPILVVMNGIDSSELRDALARRHSSRDTRSMVYSGQLGWKPGVFHLVAPYLDESKPGLWELTIVGGGPPQKVAYLRRVFQGARANFLGSVTRRKALETIASSDVALLAMSKSSQIDHAFPVKLMDYMASGVPVLAILPDNAFAALVIKQLNAGIVIPPDSLDRIPEALEELTSPIRRKNALKNGRKLVSQLDSRRQWDRLISGTFWTEWGSSLWPSQRLSARKS